MNAFLKIFESCETINDSGDDNMTLFCFNERKLEIIKTALLNTIASTNNEIDEIIDTINQVEEQKSRNYMRYKLTKDASAKWIENLEKGIKNDN